MKKKLFFLLLLAAFCTTATVHAQQRVAVGVGGSAAAPLVMLKLVDEKVIFPEGATVYRSTDGQAWQKLTATPLKMGSYTPTQAELQADSLLAQYIDISASLSSGQQEGATLLVTMLKALESLPFARYLGVAYMDEQVERGQTYYYKVFRVVGGAEQLLEITAPVTVAPYTPAAPPDSVTLNAKDGVVTVTWKPDPLRFWGVNVYRSSSIDTAYRQVNSLPLVASTRPDAEGKEGYAPEFFSDATVNNAMAYRYRVAGIDFFGRLTRLSAPVEALPLDKTPPLFPDKVQGEADKLLVRLTWDSRLQSEDMAGYRVYRGASYYQPFARVSPLLPAADSAYTDTVAAQGSYYYYIAAVDFAGNEGKSTKISVEVPDVFPPAKPRIASITADSGVITLRWHRNAEEDLAGYQLYRAANSTTSSAYAPINPQPVADTVFTDKLPFVAKNFFYYRLHAVDHAHNRSAPADVVYARMPDVVAPQQPFIREVRQEGSTLVVEWIPNTDDDLMGYHAYRFEADKAPATATQLNASLLGAGVFRFTDRFPSPNVLYKYYLTAADSSGNVSVPSTYYGAALAQEEGESAHVGQLTAAYRPRKKAVELRWEVAQGVAGYKGCVVYRRTTNGTFAPLNGLGNAQQYRDTSVAPGERYYYQVRSYTEGGRSARSLTVEVAIPEEKK